MAQTWTSRRAALKARRSGLGGWLGARRTPAVKRTPGGATSHPRSVGVVGLAGLLAGAVLAIACGSLAVPTAAAAADSGGGQGERDYLALGDSFPFGFNPLLDASKASNFVGYPSLVASALGLRLTDAACPGATAAEFVSLAALAAGCRRYQAKFPLHVDYHTSQLDYAVAFLRAHPRTRLVTLDVGLNDITLCARAVRCDLRAAIAQLGADIATIFRRIRVDAGYRGDLVGVTFPPRNYADVAGAVLSHAHNDPMVQQTLAAGGIVADGFNAFREAAAPFGGNDCLPAAGLRVQLPGGACDNHPTALGHRLLAGAVVAAVRDDRGGDGRQAVEAVGGSVVDDGAGWAEQGRGGASPVPDDGLESSSVTSDQPVPGT